MRIEVQDLTIARGGMAVLAGVTFAVAPGQALILRGPNGVGKTTLLRTIAGLQPAAGGQVRPGADAVAYAAHADAVKGTLTVAENLAFWAAVYGASGTWAALEEMALADLADRPAQSLSAGQKRRLGLARLLLANRPVWALDEPTVSLDHETVGLFARLLTRHLREGGTALITSHIDLGLEGAEELDLTPWRVGGLAGRPSAAAGFDEAFL